jgi:hypothetical protein
MSLARQGAKLFGWGLIAFTLPIIAAPRFAGRMAGISVPDASAASIMRAVAMRDVVFGAGMISAASHGGRIDRWLMLRTMIDGAALLRGSFSWRLLGLDLIALGATLGGAGLWWLARAEADGEPPQ